MIKRQLSALSSVFLSLMLLGAALAQQFDAATRTITVSPSGANDTAALQAALDSCVAFGPGCTVQLTEGTFRTQQLLTHGFHGTFRGAGQDVTIIEPAGTYSVTQDDPVTQRPPSPENPWPIMVILVDSNVAIHDLTFRVTDPEPAQSWTVSDMNITAMAAIISITGQKATADIQRITVQGSEGAFNGFNIVNGIYIHGTIPDDEGNPLLLSGQFHIHDSTFRQTLSGSPMANLTNSQVSIRNNYYEDTLLAMDAWDLNNSSVDISYNTMRGMLFSGIEIVQGVSLMPEQTNSYIIRNNRIAVLDGAAAISIVDNQETKTIQALISENVIELQEDSVAVSGDGSEGIVVRSNTITGTGVHAFQIGIFNEEKALDQWTMQYGMARGWVIVDNDFSGLSLSDVAVMLGEGSGNTTVICSSSATVMDAGTSNTVLCD